MAFDVGSVIGHIKADISNFQEGMGKAKSAADGLKDRVGAVGGAVEDFGKKAAVLTAVVGGGVVLALKKSIDAYKENQDAIAQQEAVLKSTGFAAGLFTEDLQDQAKALQRVTQYSDEATMGAQNLLLTFTNIKGATFQQATDVVLNMSTALGQDLKSSAIQVGKALQDPILGVTALRRVGVNFNEEAKKTIENLVKTGHAAEAQQFILKELNTEFGGSAVAAGKTFSGALAILGNQFGELQESIGKGIINGITPFVQKIVEFANNENVIAFFDRLGIVINAFFSAFTDWDPVALSEVFPPTVIDIMQKAHDIFVAFGNWIKENQELVLTFLKGLGIALGVLLIIGTITILLGALLNPLVLVGLAIAALYTAWQTNFLGFRDITQAVVGEIVNFFQNYLMPLIQAFVGWWKEHWDTISLILKGAWDIIKGIIQIAWSIAYGIIKVGIDLLTGKWGKAWEDIKSMLDGAWEGIKSVFKGILEFIAGWAGTVFHDLVKPFEDAWNKIKEYVEKIKEKLDFTKRSSPSVVDIVRQGVGEVNKALSGLEFNTNLTPKMAAMSISNAGQSTNINQIHVNLAGAVIADEQSAMRISEIIGDNIIQKLKLNVRA